MLASLFRASGVRLSNPEFLCQLYPIHTGNVIADLTPFQLGPLGEVLSHRFDDIVDARFAGFIADKAHLADMRRQTCWFARYAGDDYHREYVHGRSCPRST